MANIIRPLAWIGTARRERIRGRLAQALEAWADAWVMDGCETFTIQPMQAPDGEKTAPVWESPAGCCLLAMEGGLAGLGRRLCGIGVPNDGELAVAIGTRAIADLLQTVGLDQANVRSASQETSCAPWDTRYGCTFFSVSSRLGDWIFGFNQHACMQLDPPMRPPGMPLESRRSLIEGLVAQAEIRLSLGDIAVAEGLGLQPGQVLTTCIPIKAGITLQSAEGHVLAHGTLTAAGAQKAFRHGPSPTTN